MAAQAGQPLSTVSTPSTTEHRPTVLARERSMPPVVSTSIMPMTATQGTAACLMTVKIAETEKKLGTTKQAMMNRMAYSRMTPWFLAKVENLRCFSISAPSLMHVRFCGGKLGSPGVAARLHQHAEGHHADEHDAHDQRLHVDGHVQQV